MLAAMAAPAHAQQADAMMAKTRAVTERRACAAAAPGEVVVCGNRDTTPRYRLPLPTERPPETVVRGGDLANVELLKAPGDCGLRGPRRCSKREARSQGYGGGRDPITLAARLVGLAEVPVESPPRR